MDQTVLVDADVELGRQVVEALDASDLRARAAFWFYEPDAGEWRLFLGASMVDKEGPKAALSEISKALETRGLRDRLPLYRISAVGLKTSIVKALRRVIKTGSDISGVRVTNNVVNGVLIHDAYIYRMQ